MMTTNSPQISRQVGAMTLTLRSDVEIEFTRKFNAPRRLVFEAHSRPEHIRRWWGPRGTTMPVCEMDFRPGGKWRYVIRTANGHEQGFGGEYREIVPPERIVWTFGFDGMPGEPGEEVLTLVEHDGVTTLTAYSKFNSIEERDGAIASGMETGAAETWDRLEELLPTMA